MKVVAVPAWFAGTNGYLVYDESDKVAALIDAPPEPERIAAVAEDLGLTIGAVLLTHGHVDHAGGAKTLQERDGAVAYVHPDDDFLTLKPMEQVRLLFPAVPPGTYDVPEPIRYLEDKELLEVSGISFETRHTPGHTPGHCCFYVEAFETLFSGDQLFAGSIGRTDLPGGSHEELIESMRDRVLPLPDNVRVLPGHGPETTIGRERVTNPFLVGL